MCSKRLMNLIRKMFRNEDGNVTLILGLTAVPLVAIAGLAIDMGRITEARSSLQSVADGAALAAASSKGTESQREAAGMAFLSRNLPDLHGVTATPTVDVSGNDVSVSIDAVVKGTLLAVAFPTSDSLVDGETLTSGQEPLPAVSFSLSASAASGSETSYCVLAIDEDESNSVKFWGNSSFEAVDCSVHSNSQDADTMRGGGSASAKAESFSVVGGWSGPGHFTPAPDGGAGRIADPFLTLSMPSSSGSCLATNRRIRKQDGAVTLSPGKYCGGLEVETQGTVTFNPGTYVFTGPVIFRTHSVVNAPDALFYLTGNSARLEVQSQARLTLKARKTGTWAGFAVIQDRTSNPGCWNEVTSGGDVNIVGAYYTPTQRLRVTANGDMNVTSKYFPVIVEKFEMNGNGELTVGFDWAAEGMPEPKALKIANAARLVH